MPVVLITFFEFFSNNLSIKFFFDPSSNLIEFIIILNLNYLILSAFKSLKAYFPLDVSEKPGL